MKFANLTPEELFLWQAACHWRQPAALPAPGSLAWGRVVQVGLANKMATLLGQTVRGAGLWDEMPAEAQAMLAEGEAKFARKAQELTAVLQAYMPLAHQHQLESMPMKGLWVSCNLYGQAAMRPGHDLDILVRRDRLDDCIGLLEAVGFGRYWPDTLPDEFYKRHHLHLELSLPDCWTWVEIHWAFDHPRTQLTIDYEAVMDRTTEGELLGVPIWEPNPSDLLLYLSVHLVKHMVHLPATYERPDLPRLILAEGRLMYFLDVAEAVKVYAQEIDWRLLIESAEAYGAVDILGATLRVCRQYLAAPVPEWVLRHLPVHPVRGITGRLHRELAAHTLAGYLGQPTSAFWTFMVEENYKFIFRPIRLWDLIVYAFPGQSYLQRRYGGGATTAVPHFLRTVMDYGRLAIDTLHASYQRKAGHIPTFVTKQ